MSDGFALTIREERKRLGMSLSAFSQRIGTSTASLKRWEAGSSVPSAAHREHIMQAIQQGARPAYEPWQCHPGWWLRVARHRRCLSIRAAAQLTDTSPSAWHRYETGSSPIGKRQAIQLADLLGAPLDRFHLAHAYAPEDGLAEADRQVAEHPDVACAILIELLLGLEPQAGEDADAEQKRMRARAHLVLGRALMHLGDHDLSGQIAKAVVRIGLPGGSDEHSLAEVKAGCVWMGFPNIKESHLAAKRLNWLDRQIAECPAESRTEFSLVRAMFADWAGRPDLALRILDEFPTEGCAERSALVCLSKAWIYAKHGRGGRALGVSEPLLDDSNRRIAFLAHKVALEARYQQHDYRVADVHYRRLDGFRHEHGLWAPDLLARGRRIHGS